VPSGRIAVGLLELLLGIVLVAASQRMSRPGREEGRLLAVHLALHVLGVTVALYGLLQLLFALI
jgi:hypothetical protein